MLIPQLINKDHAPTVELLNLNGSIILTELSYNERVIVVSRCFYFTVLSFKSNI